MICVRRLPGYLVAIALLSTFAPAPPAPAAEGLLLKYKYSQGDKAAYSFSVSARAKMTASSGESSKAEMSLQMKVSTEVSEVSPNGDAAIQGQILSGNLKVSAEGKQETVPVESAVVNYTVTPRGGIKAAELLSGMPALLPGLFIGFGPDDAFLLAGIGQFPDKPLKPGDTWRGVARIPHMMSGEVEQVSYKSKLLGLEQFNGRRCVKIRTTARSTGTHSEEAPDGSGRLDGKSDIALDSTWRFDYERGLIMSVESADKLSITLKVSGGSDSGAVTLSGAMNSRATLTGFNGQKIGGK